MSLLVGRHCGATVPAERDRCRACGRLIRWPLWAVLLSMMAVLAALVFCVGTACLLITNDPSEVRGLSDGAWTGLSTLIIIGAMAAFIVPIVRRRRGPRK